MSPTELIVNPAFPRALVVGAFGGVALVLTAIFSRRGPLIFAPYAAFLAALTLLLARYPSLTYSARVAAGLAGFLVASAALYAATGVRADRARRRLVAEGRLPETALHHHLPLWGHAWRLGFLVGVGTVVCAGLAFVAA
jgi:hypothetical protein